MQPARPRRAIADRFVSPVALDQHRIAARPEMSAAVFIRSGSIGAAAAAVCRQPARTISIRYKFFSR
jgi:hypothetical protein